MNLEQNKYNIKLITYKNKNNQTLDNDILDIIQDIDNNTNLCNNYHLIITDEDNKIIFEKRKVDDNTDIFVEYFYTANIKNKINNQDIISYLADLRNKDAKITKKDYILKQGNHETILKINERESTRTKMYNDISKAIYDNNETPYNFGNNENDTKKIINNLKINKNALKILNKSFILITGAIGVIALTKPNIIELFISSVSITCTLKTKKNINTTTNRLIVAENHLKKLKQKK